MKYVSYHRVSTEKQGRSGLGLEAQVETISRHVESTKGELVGGYTENESGKHADRPQLLRAISHAKRARATLVIAKLDRLSRDPDFLGKLMKDGIDFVCCDMPQANKFTIRLMAAVAEQEREFTSKRTSDALQALKRRGVLLGSARPGHWDGREDVRIAALVKAREKSAAMTRQRRLEAYADVAPTIAEMRQGGSTLAGIANKLNADGTLTRNGARWTATQVSRVLVRQ